MTASTEQLYDMPMLEDALHLSRVSIFRLWERGELKRLKIGRRSFTRGADLKAFIENCRTGKVRISKPNLAAKKRNDHKDRPTA